MVDAGVVTVEPEGLDRNEPHALAVWKQKRADSNAPVFVSRTTTSKTCDDYT
jgi:hypothetical protein